MIGQILNNGTGAMVLAVKPAWRDEGDIVLCFIPSRKEFVTWHRNVDGATSSGHYTNSIVAAVEDYQNRS